MLNCDPFLPKQVVSFDAVAAFGSSPFHMDRLDDLGRFLDEKLFISIVWLSNRKVLVLLVVSFPLWWFNFVSKSEKGDSYGSILVVTVTVGNGGKPA